MTVHHHPKAAVHAIQSSPDPLASPGARRATEEASGSAPQQASSAATATAEVVAHALRWQFSNADKRRILAAADRCTRPGEVGALMRQERVYSSSLITWRRQREAGDLAALAPQKRGPKIATNRTEMLQIAQLTRERDGLQRELDRAMLVIGVQKNLPHSWTP